MISWTPKIHITSSKGASQQMRIRAADEIIKYKYNILLRCRDDVSTLYIPATVQHIPQHHDGNLLHIATFKPTVHVLGRMYISTEVSREIFGPIFIKFNLNEFGFEATVHIQMLVKPTPESAILL